MTTKNLTADYVRMRSAMHRNAPRRDGGSDGSLMGSAALVPGVDTAALTAAAPEYAAIVTELTESIGGLQGKMETLKAAHAGRLRISFDPAAENEKEQEIEILTAEITRGFNRVAARLKSMDKYTATPDASELKIRANIKRGVATRLHDLSTEFKARQSEYIGQMSKLRASSSMSALIGGGPGSGADADTDKGFTDEQMNELASAEEDVDERMREIQRIAKSVSELAVMFKELAVLIVDQGTILDRIDHNMEEAVEHTKQGVKELEKAEEFQKSARPIQCMIVLMVLIVICVIIIIAKTAGSK